VSVSVDTVRDRIWAAFAGTAHPGEGQVAHCSRCEDEMDVQIVEAVESWAALTPADLRGISLAFFSPEGFRFTLPALMLHVLSVWNSDDPAVDATVWGLGPAALWDTEDEGNLPERNATPEASAAWYSKVRVLTADQRSAIVSFLGTLADLAQSDEYLRQDALKAQNWWMQYKPDEPAA
jgi:hypothetical protein